MKQIETEHASLEELPQSVREFYEVVDGVVVLNRPENVTYEYVHGRRARRHPWSTTKSALISAIEYEYFSVNHDQYLQWLDEVSHWEETQPTIIVGQDTDGNDITELSPKPELPTVDMDLRRECYEVIVVPNSDELVTNSSTYTDTVNDDEYTINRTYDTEPKSDTDIAKILKLRGIEFEGVMCSATKEDMWGLSSAEKFIRLGNATNFEFDNGSLLSLTPDNIDLFYGVWAPFRASFFN